MIGETEKRAAKTHTLKNQSNKRGRENVGKWDGSVAAAEKELKEEEEEE